MEHKEQKTQQHIQTDQHTHEQQQPHSIERDVAHDPNAHPAHISPLSPHEHEASLKLIEEKIEELKKALTTGSDKIYQQEDTEIEHIRVTVGDLWHHLMTRGLIPQQLHKRHDDEPLYG